MGAPLYDIGQIVGMLAQRADQLARELLPGGRREGREWTCGDLSGAKGRGVSVCIAGPKAGVWGDFQGGSSGDALDLVAVTRCGGNKAEALKWARGWLGIGPAHAGRGPAPVPPRPRNLAEETEKGEKRRARGKALWLSGSPIAGTPVEAYLAGRGIGLDALGRAPRALRFHPRVWCAERSIEAPAMLAAITAGPDTIGVHRTYLAEDGAGGWRKAPIRSAKKVLGQAQGGCIPLWRGASDKPLREAPEGDAVAIAEGIEDALTVALHCPEWRVLACISVGNMGEIALPEAITDVRLVFDRDGENVSSRAARDRAERRYLSEGRSVHLLTPPEGFKDFNEWHQAEVAREGKAA
jgi:hypothetical protein